MKSLSCVQLFATPWIVAHQTPRSMGFSRHEYRSGVPFPSPGDLPDPAIKPGSPAKVGVPSNSVCSVHVVEATWLKRQCQAQGHDSMCVVINRIRGHP